MPNPTATAMTYSVILTNNLPAQQITQVVEDWKVCRILSPEELRSKAIDEDAKNVKSTNKDKQTKLESQKSLSGLSTQGLH